MRVFDFVLSMKVKDLSSLTERERERERASNAKVSKM
jgi:hypothetical protein